LTGIGYKAIQEDGHECGGPCPYGIDDNYNYFWMFDVNDILSAGSESEPRPYSYGIWDVPFDDNGAHGIIGGTYDQVSSTLYIVLRDAAQVGDYDRPPLVVTFSVPILNSS
jgi:hypothetical protein